MKLKCLHGFFIFSETKVGQVSDFMSLTGLEIEPLDNFFTFKALVDAPKYSINGGPILNATSIVTCEGNQWDVFKENSLVYDFSRDLVVPISSITQKTTVKLSGNFYLSPGLILPGSIDQDGNKIKDYSAFYSRDRGSWLYSEVTHV
jgi:hypothetical protein